MSGPPSWLARGVRVVDTEPPELIQETSKRRQRYVARAVTGDRSISAAEGSTSETAGGAAVPHIGRERRSSTVRHRPIQPVAC
jgi:hypothetical protein